MGERIQEAIIEGIKKAQNDYWDMSGYWLREGAEYWVTTYVARKLWKTLGDDTVAIEVNSDDIRKDAKSRKKGKNFRHDIATYFKNGNPRAVIEIKNVRANNTSPVLRDIGRVIDTLKSADLRFGAVGYLRTRYTKNSRDETVSDTVNSYAERLEQKASNLAKKTEGISVDSKRHSEVDGESAWLAGCIIIERK